MIQQNYKSSERKRDANTAGPHGMLAAEKIGRFNRFNRADP